MWRVMIADDEAVIREGITRLISWGELNCELVYAAKNGKDLLDHLEEYKPHIVITDIQMPVVGGLEAARHIKEQYPDMSVILLTAYSDFKYAQEAIHYNVRDYVLKTSLLEDIPVAIRSVVEKMEENSVSRITKVERIFLRTLMDESYYFDDMAPDFEDYYEKYSQFLSRFQLLVIQQVQENHAEEKKQDSFLKFIESSFGHEKIKAFPISESEYCVLCSLEGQEKNLRKSCETLLTMGQSFMGIRMIIGISRKYEGIRFVTMAYQEARNLVRRHFAESGREIYDAREEQTKRQGADAQLSIQVEHLLERIETDDSSGRASSWERFKEVSKQSQPAQVRSAYIVLLSGCRRFFRNVGKNLDEELCLQKSPDAEILNSKHLSDVERMMEEVIRETAEVTRAQRECADGLLDQVNQYIEENFRTKLTLKDIAHAVHTNRSYLSRIYKERTGQNLFDVITARKVEEAKCLLSGKMKIYEVAEMVGFEDTAYFSKVFKKYTGVSPKDFERENREGSL